MPAEANGDAAAVPGNFDNFDHDNFSFVEFFRLRSHPHLPGVQRELQEALRVQGGQQNGTGHADVERNAPVSGDLWRAVPCLTKR